ncbi:MAG: hypothetical protein R3Y23_00265 [Bacillota bacterium]
MLQNKKEKALIAIIYKKASASGGQCVVTPLQLLEKLPLDVEFKEDDLEPTLKALSLDGYFEYTEAQRKGEATYCIILKEKGHSYMRDRKTARIKIYRKIGITIAFALLSWLVKLVIDLIVG